MRFAVLGEGTSEHGDSDRGPTGTTFPHSATKGCLVVLVERVLKERLGLPCTPVRWNLQDRATQGRPTPPPPPFEILVREHLLAAFLDKLLNPVARQPAGPAAVDFVVLSVDETHEAPFWRTVERLRGDLRKRVVPTVFEPELEVLLVQSKIPLESSFRLPSCSSTSPSIEGDLKESLRAWLRQYVPSRALTTQLRQEIAHHLDIRKGSYLDKVAGWRQLVERLETTARGHK